jgi:hypothetical protein
MSAERKDRRDPAVRAIGEGQIVRFTVQDMPAWGNWLLDRCGTAWPQFRREFWQQKFGPIIGSNDYLFIRNERCVLLIQATPRIMDGRIVLQEVFAWSRDAIPQKHRNNRILITDKETESERHLLSLYRHARGWAKSMGAARLFVAQCSDMTPARLRDTLQADECGWVSIRL